MEPQPTRAIEVFYSYAHEDKKLRDELVKHLANLKRQGIITDWYDRDISAGKEWDGEIKEHLESAGVILLLVSPDFMNSDYCNDVEVKRAMERHEAREARIIPVILRYVDWEGAPFSKLHALPTGARPVKSWRDRDEAFLDVTKGIRKAIQELSGSSANIPAIPNIPRPPMVGFVSRRGADGRDLLERLREDLAPQKNQLVALWGAGGVGKTTLAAEAARSIAETFGRRVIWITADGRANFAFSTLLDEIGEQLGRPDLRSLAIEQKEKALRPHIAAALILIILDSFETISSKEQALCKDFMVQRALCPILITTRKKIDDEHVTTIALENMSLEEANEYLDRLISDTQYPDIYAEIDRNHILRTAEFNPLIIQWIVAQIDETQEPRMILEELAQGEGNAAQRVFDRSFDLLSDDGRAVLLALSLFVQSAKREALAEVAGFGDDLKRLSEAVKNLRALWLVKGIDGNRRLTVGGLTRGLAAARLSKDERAEELHHRFVTYFLNYIQAHAQQTPEDFDALEAEKDNVLSAVESAFHMRDWDNAVQAFFVVEKFLDLRDYWDEAAQRGEQALKAAIRRNKIDAIPSLIAIEHNNRELARRTYEQAISNYEQLGKEKKKATVYHQLAVLEYREGNFAKAREYYNESWEIKKRLDDKRGCAIIANNFGLLAKDEGNIEEAKTLLNNSLEIFNELESPFVEIARRNLEKLEVESS